MPSKNTERKRVKVLKAAAPAPQHVLALPLQHNPAHTETPPEQEPLMEAFHPWEETAGCRMVIAEVNIPER
jgi:hypothetical protein